MRIRYPHANENSSFIFIDINYLVFPVLISSATPWIYHFFRKVMKHCAMINLRGKLDGNTSLTLSLIPLIILAKPTKPRLFSRIQTACGKDLDYDQLLLTSFSSLFSFLSLYSAFYYNGMLRWKFIGQDTQEWQATHEGK